MTRQTIPAVSRERVERAARMYPTSAAAAAALEMAAPTGFARLCRRYGVPTPYERRHGKSAVRGQGSGKPPSPPSRDGRRRSQAAIEAAKVRALFEADREARRKGK